MGLANDPNKVIKIPNHRQEIVKQAKTMVRGSDSEAEEEIESAYIPPKKEVAERLMTEARAPRERKFWLVFSFIACNNRMIEFSYNIIVSCHVTRFKSLLFVFELAVLLFLPYSIV